ncbi:MAG: toprim domain-containing protein [Planctomycetota bacterium]
MTTRAEELQQFKKINLAEYAISRGFTLDQKASSRSSIVARHSNGSKLIIGRSACGGYHYFNAKGDDSGTIIDLVQALDGGTIGDVRKTLRRYQPSTTVDARAPRVPVEMSSKTADLDGVRSGWNQASPLTTRSAYLSDCRAIPGSIYLSPRFEGRFRTDRRGNVLAAHRNEEGLCGFEIKNGTKEKTTFTGFSPGGTKGLCVSRASNLDERLIVTETFIDMLSVAAFKGLERTRFASISGRPSRAQLQLLAAEARRFTTSVSVELCFDNDDAGQELAELVAAALGQLDCVQAIEFKPPPAANSDWNDHLRSNSNAIRSHDLGQT